MKTEAQARLWTNVMVIAALAWACIFVQDLVTKRHHPVPPPATSMQLAR